MKLSNIRERIKGEVAILWFWKEGKSSLAFLEKLWAKNITIHDKKEILEKKDNIKYITWEKYLNNLDKYDLIIKTPWISPYVNWLEKHKDKITTQAEIFINNYDWKVIWITWTKWKSTTVTLLYLTLKEVEYNTKLVWNIWSPVLDEVDILWNEKYDYIVYEMSSYMLEWLNASLYVWYINNIYNCHLDWHDGKENYVKAKINAIKKSQNKICNIEAKDFTKNIEWIVYFWEWTNILYNRKNKTFTIDWEVILEDKDFILKWEHNRINILWVISILKQIKQDKHDSNWIFSKLILALKTVLESFSWLEHRQQNIWTYKWITFIDDAIATTPESTIAALKTFEHKIWTLFLWGQDSWFKFDQLRKTIKEYWIKNIVLFPDTWEKIFWDLSNYNYETIFEINNSWEKIKILKTKFMEKAIDFAYKNTAEWKICLLSNAAPSFSLWSWYIEKWAQFQRLVKQYSLK